ncbi:hypothetical protein C3489_23035 [Streptomyces sp. Ru71]|uniref:hypothetical protein n=1 Tax=Streptomyces sp. Ru71 TaxID=2080746 RepID=UPI000CDE0E38|nr:hypothetical protein [Streptomyces sp. Ru71]POX50128.1 hypothetical protein C3489_23035 [Streptomyces sp. Ru71]
MTEPVFYVDRSDIRPGMLAEARQRMAELVDFVREREPRLIAYRFYEDADASTMTVVAVHPDSASMELHLRLGGPGFRRLGECIRLRSVDVYGPLAPAAAEAVRAKARMLGGAAVTFHTLRAGFGRFTPPAG